MRRVLVTLALAVLVLMGILAISPRRQAQNLKHLTFVIAYKQAGAPIDIQSVTHTMDFLYGSATVTNVSDQIVRSISFGVLMHETGPDWSKPTLASSREIATNLRPGETRSIDIEDLPIRDAKQKASELRSNPVPLEFGILSVQFADGTTWNYDWRGQGGFNKSSAAHSGLDMKSLADATGCKGSQRASILAELSEFWPGITSVFAQSGYTCGASEVSQFCTNNVSSCTDTMCTKGKPCPLQQCNVF